MKWMRLALLALAGAAALGTFPGCGISVGSTRVTNADSRLDALEGRVRAAEQRLGIPSPEKE